STFLSRMVS
ncbi:hypothetical protein D046_8402B, partial [Vibrio parahaemolyticus V-223/04]